MRNHAVPQRCEREQVQVWLGHHSPSFTLDTYVHVLPEDQFDPEKLAGIFTPSYFPLK